MLEPAQIELMEAGRDSDEMAIHYPVTVDAKKLWALIGTGDAIIHNPKPDRIAHWEKLRAIIAAQCKKQNPEGLKAAINPEWLALEGKPHLVPLCCLPDQFKPINIPEISWAAGQVWKTEHNHLMTVESVRGDGVALIGMLYPYKTRTHTQKLIPAGWVRVI